MSYRLLRDTTSTGWPSIRRRFRGGIGTALVRAAVSAELRMRSCRRVPETNSARSLYLREGFEQADELEVDPGLRVTRYRLPHR